MVLRKSLLHQKTDHTTFGTNMWNQVGCAINEFEVQVIVYRDKFL